MKVLTAAEMREVDRRTMEAGIPGLILMENAGSRVVDFLIQTFAPLAGHHVAVVCGKGNNGGDGFVVARQLWTRGLCRALTVYEVFDPEQLQGDAAENRRMLAASGCPIFKLRDELQFATLVVDAIVGTGLTGEAQGPAADAIRFVNERFPLAETVALDIPSGLSSDGADTTGAYVRVRNTVTFTAAKRSQVLSPVYEKVGRLKVVPIGTPPAFCETNSAFRLNLTTESDLRTLFEPRLKDSNKGLFGHVLVVGGSYGKSGAPTMAGMGSYRSGAGLVTVAIPESALPMVAGYRPELMTEPSHDVDHLLQLLEKMTVLAAGPGLGTSSESVVLAQRLYAEADVPGVFDADALNALAGKLPKTTRIRILTPHPGEMSRLTGKSTKEVQRNRLGVAEAFAADSGATVVLKGDRTVIAFPDGETRNGEAQQQETWINPTGAPSMATGGTGDILTGLIAGMIAQHPKDWKRAVVAAVWLHGRCGELGSARWGEQSMLAADLLDVLPEAMNELRPAR